MKKIISIIIVIIALFTLTGCLQITSVIESIEVDKTTIPTEVTVEDFRLSDIQLIIHKTDNTSTVRQVTRSMLSSDALDKLTTPGTHNIYVRYEGKTDLMTIVLLEKYPSMTVTFETFGGSIIDDQIVSKNSTAFKPTNPKKEGYVFGGWYIDVETKVEFQFTSKIVENTTLYAKWVPSGNVVTLVFGEGFNDQLFEVATDGVFYEPEKPTKEGYTFGGWYVDEAFENLYQFTTIVKNSFSLYAKWIPEEYIIKFESNIEAKIEDVKALRDSKVVCPSSLTNEGYMIEGWYLDKELTNKYDFDSLVKSNLTLYAKWVEARYNISFDTDGGTNIPSVTVSYNELLGNIPQPTKLNYTFGGWYLDKEFKEAFDSTKFITKDITLYAKWDSTKYAITFEENGGSEVNNIEVEMGNIASKPTDPTRENYIFSGWYTDSDLTRIYNWSLVVNQDITLYAKWDIDPTVDIHKHTIYFDSDGGSEVANIIAFDGYKAVAPTPPTKEGYTFAGWYHDETFEMEFDFDIPIVRDYTLIAKWLTNYTVTFVDYSGKVIKSQVVGEGLSATAPATPVREGYDFIGWTPSFSDIRRDITVRPNYSIAKYRIIFQDYDGTVIFEQEIQYGSSAIVPSDPSSRVDEGYHFIGWDKNTTNVSSDLVVTAKYEINTYKVTFVDFDNNILSEQNVPHKGRATNITVSKQYFELLNWYNENTFEKLFNFAATEITSDITIYGKFDFIDSITYKKENNEIIILNWNIDGIKELIVPLDLNGEKIVAIEALENFDMLEAITISQNLQSINYQSLKDAPNLKEINVSSLNQTLASVNGVLYNKDLTELNVYPKAKSDVEYALEQTVTEIKDEAFKDNKNLIRLIVPSTLSKIGANAFCNSNISSLDLSSLSTVPTVNENTFKDVNASFKVVTSKESFESFNESFANIKVCSLEYVFEDFLYLEEASGITIVQYLGNDMNVVIPSIIASKNVTKIASYAFYGLKNIRGITFASTITDLEDNALADLNLEYIIASSDFRLSTTYQSSFNELLKNAKVYLTSDLLASSTAFSSLVKYDSSIIEEDYAFITENGSRGILQYLGTSNAISIDSNQISFIKENAFRGLSNLKTITITGEKFVNLSEEFDKSILLIVPSINLDLYKEIYQNSKIYPDTMEIKENSDYVYGVLNGKVTIIEVISWSEALNLASEIDGLTVDTIGRFALYFMSDLTTEVQVPEAIKYLDDYALYNDNSINCNIRFLGAPPSRVGSSICNSDDVVLVSSDYYNQFMKIFTECSVHHTGSIIAQNEEYRYSIFNNSIGIVKYIGSAEDVVIPSTINGLNVTTIYAMAFANNEKIKTLTISKNVDSIGYKAFHNCCNLLSVTVNTDVVPKANILADSWILFLVPEAKLESYLMDEAWNKYQIYKVGTEIRSNSEAMYIQGSDSTIYVKYIGNAQSIRINRVSGYVSEIGAYAFYDSSLVDITFGSNVNKFGYKAFPNNPEVDITIDAASATLDNRYQYDNLKLFVDEKYIEDYRNSEFFKGYTLYEEGTIFGTFDDFYYSSYGGYATIIKYLGNKSILSVPTNISSSEVSVIADYAFRNNNSLTNVYLPNTVKVIGDYAFYGCSLLGEVGMSTTITEIGVCAFQNTPWYELNTTEMLIFNDILYKVNTTKSTVTIPETVRVIADYAFSGLATLSTISIPENVKVVKAYAFYNCINLTSVDLSSSTFDAISEYCFAGCLRLRNITLSSSIKSIGEYAFLDCQNLSSVTLSDNITSIADYAFMNCEQLTTVILPLELSRIGNGVFTGCTNLMEVSISSGNISFVVEDNLLYSIDKKTIIKDLVLYNRNTLVINENVELIKSQAFLGSMFNEVIIKSSNLTIEEFSFVDNKNLTKIIIDTTVLPKIVEESFASYEKYVYVYNDLVDTALNDEYYQKYEIKPVFSFTSSAANVILGNTFDLLPTFIFGEAEYEITYLSSNEDVIRMVNSKLTAVARGRATISATINYNPEQTCIIIVNVL